ncbi:MAG: hypothetical protein ACT4QB_23680 [Gammaproteobacteria bacterium]
MGRGNPPSGWPTRSTTNELSLALMYAHLDHDSCMELTILLGKADMVQHFAEHVIAERGVRHGRIVLVPTDILIKPHTHGDGTTHEHPHRPAGRHGERPEAPHAFRKSSIKSLANTRRSIELAYSLNNR